MHEHRLSYAATGRFSPVVLDHLANDPFLRAFLEWPPTVEGLRTAAAGRTFSLGARGVLCTALEEQHAGLELHPAVRANLDLLRKENCLTVTTGHQLCLFTGPLYVPYKILNAIRLARQATEALEQPVVPVFWMASEDHDVAEVDHAFINGEKVQWTGASTGAVGRMPLTGIRAVVEQAVGLLGDGPSAGEIASALRTCYTEDRTLAEATRRFVHELFGHLGLVIVDGDDPALKRLFAPVILEELVNQVTERTVRYADERIKERYAVQAHAREINLFHLRPGHRSRITRDRDHYLVQDGGPRWTLDELLIEAQVRPQDFSPNVLLRPVYQETVLPNIAYIGGGGELAYWIQLRWLFQGLRVPMPVVILRTSAADISSKHLRQWEELGLTRTDLFAPLDVLKARVARERSSFSTSLEDERQRLATIYRELADRAASIDLSLRGAVEAQRVRAMRGTDRLEQGLLRAAKREQETALRRMDAVHAALFPNGELQERRDNILPLLANKGKHGWDRLIDVLDPLRHEFTLIEEQ
ncbi:MAG TPA: bacillithiol biosynthesis cysteine-adding enzyme BshC [Flavobacteriales bacterium]|nr:bacillithiol biosynthesis cysteine-adding enzyme BshC [Flavobacteriales bacterium]